MAQPYPVVGIEETGIHPRLEIRHLQKDPIQFSLFIQALNKVFEKKNFEDELSPDYINKPDSWWQMGSIHGLPYLPWSGDPNGPQVQDPKSAWGGYCYHGSALFPTWHRILVLLIEQAVVREALVIASELEIKYHSYRDEGWLLSAKVKWFVAATKLRFPFWDWTKRETVEEGIPLILQLPTIEIANPDGTFATVNNPLNHYRFTLRPGAAQGFEYMGNWQRTYRWVNDLYNPTEERYTRAHEAFSRGLALHVPGLDITLQLKPVDWLRQKVAALFDYPLTLSDPSYGPNVWGHFATTGAKDVYIPEEVEEKFGNIAPNIEEPHNKVHLDIGGIGSMSLNEYASFDPIFFLHHCNIDRIYAFWEYVYPKYTIENGWKDENGNTIPFKVDEDGTFAQDPFATEDHTTPLVPFRKKDLRYWNTDDTQSLLKNAPTKKHYTYPAIPVPGTDKEVKVDVPYDVSDETLRETYRQTLYNEWGQSLASTVATIEEFARAAPGLNRYLLSHLWEKNARTSYLRNFVVTGKIPEFAFPGSYHLQLYLRPEVIKERTPLVVNSISVFARANPEKCAACKDRREAGSQIRGYMHLDPVVILYLISLYSDDPKSRWPNLPPPATQLQGSPFDLNYLANLVKASLGVRLVKPDGAPLAIPDPNIRASATVGEAQLPRLTLHSRRTNYSLKPLRDAISSVHLAFDQAVNHGEIPVGGGWKVVTGLH